MPRPTGMWAPPRNDTFSERKAGRAATSTARSTTSSPNSCARVGLSYRQRAARSGGPHFIHTLLGNLGLHELAEELERLLPAQVAHLGRDHRGNTFLHDIQIYAARDWRDDDGGNHLPRQVRVVE